MYAKGCGFLIKTTVTGITGSDTSSESLFAYGLDFCSYTGDCGLMNCKESHSRDVGTRHTGQEDSIVEEKYAIIHNMVRSTGVDFENTFSHPTIYLARKTNI